MYGHCIWHRRLLRYQSAIRVYARAVASFITLALTAPQAERAPDCGVLLVFGAPFQLRLLAGLEHGRTIPLTDMTLAALSRGLC